MDTSEHKIISKEAFANLRENFRREGKTVVLCHGVFDLLHYGHIEHLREAKAQGDVLVVSVTAARFVNKGPGRPYFNDAQRLSFLSELDCVDYVLLSEAVTVHDIVRCVQPDIYVKGQEYANAASDVTGNIGPEQAIVEQYGGRIYFTQGEVYSSTKLLNNFFGALPEAVVQMSRGLREKYGADVAEQARRIVDDFAKLNVLVVGDIIIDDYVFCKVQGLTTKDAAMSTRFDFRERYAGGALAIARHLANFAGHVTLLSMMGMEQDIADDIVAVMPPVDCRIVQDEHFVTSVKRRYLKRHAIRQQYEKLFSVNHLLDIDGMRQVDYRNFYRNLEEMLPQYDLVVVCDYGHGLIDAHAMELLEQKSRFLALNCQTNSSNHGHNIITKYHHADMFVVDEQELHLAYGQSLAENDELLAELCRDLHSTSGWVTMGAVGALGRRGDDEAQIPAVTLHVKDTVGAGDAFYALAVLCAKADAPIDLATLLANIAGAIKTNVVGNARPVAKVDLLKFLATILNV